jgi:hypothetical protein
VAWDKIMGTESAPDSCWPGVAPCRLVRLLLDLQVHPPTPTVTLNTYVHEWPDVVDRTRSLIDNALRERETAAMPAGSRT